MKKKVGVLAGLLAVIALTCVACQKGKTSASETNSEQPAVSESLPTESESLETPAESESLPTESESLEESFESETPDLSAEESEEEDEECLVTFDTDGGSKVDPVSVVKGGKIMKPNDPQKSTSDGEYEFLGWYYGENAWNFETDTVEENITLTAKWKLESGYTKPFLPKD